MPGGGGNDMVCFLSVAENITVPLHPDGCHAIYLFNCVSFNLLLFLLAKYSGGTSSPLLGILQFCYNIKFYFFFWKWFWKKPPLHWRPLLNFNMYATVERVTMTTALLASRQRSPKPTNENTGDLLKKKQPMRTREIF